MKILGIDPGTEICGWAVLELKRGDPNARHIESGAIRPGGRSLEARLRSLGWHITRICKRLHPDQLAIEAGFVGINNATSLTLGEARGAIILATGKISVDRYQPSTVKKCATGNGRADKWMVARCMEQRLKLAFMPEYDIGDAIAVALTHAERTVVGS